MRPGVIRILRNTLADLGRHPGPHLRASAPMVAVSVTSIIASIYAAIPLESAGMQLLFRLEDEVVAFALYLLLAGLVVPTVVSSLPYLPMYVGMLHTQRAWLEEGQPPAMGTVFRRALVGLLGAGLVLIPMWSVEGILIWAGLLPAVVVEAIGSFVVVGIVVDRMPPLVALRRSIRHFVAAPLWRLGIAAATMLASFVALVTVLPLLLLPAFCTNATLRAYRAAYPSGAGAG